MLIKKLTVKSIITKSDLPIGCGILPENKGFVMLEMMIVFCSLLMTRQLW